MTMVQTSEDDIDFSVARPGTNVVLVAEGKEIHVNKEFLASFSPYFNTLLLSPDFAESSSPRIDIEHDYNQLLKCVQIAHGNVPLPTVPLSLEEMEQLLKSADRFDLSVVRRYCASQLALCYHTNDCKNVDRYILAWRYNLNPVKKDLFVKTTKNDWLNWRNRLNPTHPYYASLAYANNLLPIDAEDAQLTLTVAELHSIIQQAL